MTITNLSTHDVILTYLQHEFIRDFMVHIPQQLYTNKMVYIDGESALNQDQFLAYRQEIEDGVRNPDKIIIGRSDIDTQRYVILSGQREFMYQLENGAEQLHVTLY